MEQVFRILGKNVVDDKKSVLPVHFRWGRKNNSRVGDWLIAPHSKVFSLDATERKFRFHIDPQQFLTLDAQSICFRLIPFATLCDFSDPDVKGHFQVLSCLSVEISKPHHTEA